MNKDILYRRPMSRREALVVIAAGVIGACSGKNDREVTQQSVTEGIIASPSTMVVSTVTAEASTKTSQRANESMTPTQLVPTVATETRSVGIQPTEVILPTTTIAPTESEEGEIPQTHWRFTAIDTMKTSRDRAREDVSDEAISHIVAAVKEAGATHIAIGTPYNDVGPYGDPEESFIPYMKRWVNKARENDIKVWFRGNFCEWEEWFDYPTFKDVNGKPDPSAHHIKTRDFIATYGNELFEDGDIFTPCPEPENGKVIGSFWESEDNKQTYRQFMIDSYTTCEESFTKLELETGKKVEYGYFSCNGDVAKAIGVDTVQKIGNKIGIDHYVPDPNKMGTWIDDMYMIYGDETDIFIGEFGAPIPDLNGEMNENEQALFIDLLFQQMIIRDVLGVNYWTIYEGSTALLNEDDGSKRKAYDVVSEYYHRNTTPE